MLKDMVTSLQSYVKDTRDVLSQISNIHLEEEILLVGIDVESLYTSIPHQWEIKAVETFLKRHYPDCGPQNEFVVNLLTFAFNKNFFQFESRFFQQIKGTSMGAPAYACLQLGLWEEDLIFTLRMYLGHIYTCLGYIDDVLMIWRGDVASLETFML